MKKSLSIQPSEFLSFSETLGINEEGRIDHTKCSAGEDTRRRLYVKRNIDGSIVAHCHNCGESGVIFPTKLGNVPSKEDSKIDDNSFSLPDGINYNPDEWPTAPTVWYRRYGITRDWMHFYGAGWSDKEKLLYFPMSEDDGKHVGYNARNFNPKTMHSMKYKTKFDPKWLFRSYYTWSGCSTLVITEDILSAIKITQITDCSSLALLGTMITNEALSHILKEYDQGKIYIHLDDDKAGREGTRKLANMLPDARYWPTPMLSPKELSREELTDMYCND